MAEARGLPNLTLIQEKTKTHSCLTHWFSVVGLPLHAIKFAKKKEDEGGKGEGEGRKKDTISQVVWLDRYHEVGIHLIYSF